MSLNIITREDNQSEVDETDKDFCENNKFTDTVDRKEISWMLNLILNVKSQEEIAQDITDGVFQMVEIENMFPLKYLQELRTGNYESTQNYVNRFKHMSGERIKDVLISLLKQNRQNDLISEVGYRVLSYGSASLINGVKNLIKNKRNMNSQSTSNTSSMVPGELESCNIFGTKKKRVAKKNVNINSNKKDEKTKKVAEITKKVRNMKLTKNKLCGNIDDKNNIEETNKEIALSKENQKDNENTSDDLIYSTASYQETSKESSFNDQKENEDRSTDAGPKIVKNPVQKNKKIGTKKKPGPKKSNVPIENSSSKCENKMVESEKSKINENVTNDEKEESNLTKSNDCHEDLSETRNNLDSEKSLSNEAANISNSKNGDIEICSNQNQEIPDVQKYVQLNESTSKESNIDIIQIKKEAMELDSYESNYSINEAEENLLIKNTKRSKNSNPMPIKYKVQQSNNIPEKSELVKSESTSKKKKISERDVTKYITNNREKTSHRRKKEVHERQKKDKLRKYEQKIRNNLEEFKDQMTKLVKDMRHVGVDEEESSDCSTDSSTDSSTYYSSEEISSTSSYTESSSDTSSECSSDSSRVYSSGSSEECSCIYCQSDSFSEEESDENNDCQYHKVCIYHNDDYPKKYYKNRK